MPVAILATRWSEGYELMDAAVAIPLAACLGLPPRMVALAGSIGAAAMAQRRCNERPISDQEFLTIAKIVI